MAEKIEPLSIYSHEVFESLPIGLICLDSRGNITYLNPEAEKITANVGSKRQNLMGKEVKKIFLESSSSFYEQYQKVKVREKKAQWIEFFPELQAWLNISIFPAPDGMFVLLQDVSQEKRLAEKLIENESRFLTLMEGSLDVVIYLDEQGNISFVNQNVKKIFGYSQEELIGKHIGVLVCDKEKSSCLKMIENLMETWRKPFHWERVEIMGLHKNGNPMPIEFSLVELVENQKHILIGIIRDISERKEKEEILGKSESLFKTLFFKNPAPMWIYDQDTLKFLVVNDAACEKFGYSKEEFGKMTILDLKTQTDDSDFLEQLKFWEKGGDQDAELSCQRLKNGKIICGEMKSSALDFGGKKGVLVILKDMTKRMEEAGFLRDNEVRYRLFFEANPLPMYLFDGETLRFLDVNEAGVQQYGYSKEEFLELTMFDIRPPAEKKRLQEYVSAFHEKEETYAGIWVHQHKNGDCFEVEIMTEPIFLKERKVFLSIAKKVHDKR